MFTATKAEVHDGLPADETTGADRPATHELPFVKTNKSGVNFWSPARFDSYEQNCELGRAYAQVLLNFITKHDNHVILGTVIGAMVREGKFEGVEIGFCNRLGLELRNAPDATSRFT